MNCVEKVISPFFLKIILIIVANGIIHAYTLAHVNADIIYFALICGNTHTHTFEMKKRDEAKLIKSN